MANANIARGLIPSRFRNGAPYNGASRTYYVPSTYGTNIFVGDPLILVTVSTESSGIPIVNVATAAGGAYVIGSCVGIGQAGNPPVAITRDMPPYHQASTAGYIQVADDPEILFEVQENGAMGIGAVGRNVDLVSAAGSTASGYSGWMLNSSTLATTATLQMRVVYPVIREDNDPTLTNAKWLCAINLHAMIRTTGI